MAGSAPRTRRTAPEPRKIRKNLMKTLGVTGLTVRQQRQVAIAIKNAREMALLPYWPRVSG